MVWRFLVSALIKEYMKKGFAMDDERLKNQVVEYISKNS